MGVQALTLDTTKLTLDATVYNTATGVTGGLKIVRGDDYDATTGLLEILVSSDYTLLTWTGIFTVRHRVTGAVIMTSTAVVIASASKVTVQLSSTDTAMATLTTDQDFGAHPFDLQFTSGGSKRTELGVVNLCKDHTTS